MTDAKRQRCIVYVRQSLARQGETEDTSLSLDAQETRLKAYAEKQGWVVTQSIRDHDEKGDDPDRPGILDVLALAKDHAADIVLVFAMSRFARDQVWQEITYRKLKAYGVKVVSVNEPNIEHTLFRGVMGVVNQYASEQTAQFVKVAFTQRVERGLTHGPPPYGYRKVLKQIYVDETEAEIVRTIFARWLAGDGIPTISETLIAAGMKPRRSNTFGDHVVRNIIRNPVYAGFSHINGQRSPGLHKPIIDLETWDRAQDLFSKRPRTKHLDRPSWCEGLVYHSCGRRMYAIAYLNQGEESNYAWQYVCRSRVWIKSLRCTDGRSYIATWKVEQAAREALAVDLGARLSLDAAVVRARELAGGKEVERSRRTIEQTRTALAGRLKRAETLYLDGKRNHEWFVLEEERASLAVAALDREEAALPTAVNDEDLALAASRLDAFAAIVAHLTGPDLRLWLEQLGTIRVDESGVSIAYAPAVARFVPSPAIIPVATGWGPDRQHTRPRGRRPKVKP